MSIKKVVINPGCTSCGLCSFLAPEVFTIREIAEVVPSADYETHKEMIKLAESSCPVSVIAVEEDQ